MNIYPFLLDVSTKVGSGTVPDSAASSVPPDPAATGMMMNPIMMIVLYCLVIFGALYFFSIRPQKKREKALEDLRSKICTGDSVLLSNGMFGTVVDITAECFVIEFGTNKGVRIPVIKQEVLTKREPNLSNKVEVVEQKEPEKKSLFGFGKAKDEQTK